MNEFNIEYEYILINIMLLDNTLIDIIRGEINEEAFYDPKTRRLYQTICAQYDKNGCCNISTLISELKNINPAEIAELTNRTCSTENWEFYAEKIRNFYKVRKYKVYLSEKAKDLNVENVNDSLAEIDSQTTTFLKFGGGKASSAQDLCNRLVSNIQKASKNTNQYLGYDTGWEKLSSILDGIQTGRLTILGARPSVGKTSFAIQLGSNLCKQKVPVCYFSLEMTADSLMTRLTSVESGITINQIKHGDCCKSQSSLIKLNNTLSKIYDMPLRIYDDGVKNEKDLFARIRIEAKTKGTKVFFVDHIGLVRHSNSAIKRVEQLDDITQRLLHLAQELDVAIICLCQLRRDAEGKEPCLNDLRDSGAIEQNADICMFLHRARAEGDEMSIPAKVIVIKDRDGGCGTCEMNFFPRVTKFEAVVE